MPCESWLNLPATGRCVYLSHSLNTVPEGLRWSDKPPRDRPSIQQPLCPILLLCVCVCVCVCVNELGWHVCFVSKCLHVCVWCARERPRQDLNLWACWACQQAHCAWLCAMYLYMRVWELVCTGHIHVYLELESGGGVWVGVTTHCWFSTRGHQSTSRTVQGPPDENTLSPGRETKRDREVISRSWLAGTVCIS